MPLEGVKLVRHGLIALTVLLLSACASSEGNAAGNQQQPADANGAAERPARNPYVVDEEVDGLSFSYGWPADADAIPDLRVMLNAEMERERTEALGNARDGQRIAAEENREFQPHYYSRSWTIAGNNAQLLSLSAQQETFSGGAHGNRQFHALVWDRSANAPVRAADLLGSPLLDALKPRFCAALDVERARRRGEPVESAPRVVDAFVDCPNLREVVLSPTDDDENNRFERVMVLLPPYAVGSYAEGDYVIDLPFQQGDLARIPAQFRASFEPGRPLPPPPDDE